MQAPNTLISRPEVAGANAAGFDEVVEAAKKDFGVILFTVLAWDASRGVLQRIYTTHQEEYPVSGEKRMPMDAPWPQTVLIRQQPFICHSPSDIQSTFNDYPTISELGCGQMICLPVIKAGEVLGAISFSGVDGTYGDAAIHSAKQLLPACVEALVVWKRT